MLEPSAWENEELVKDLVDFFKIRGWSLEMVEGKGLFFTRNNELLNLNIATEVSELRSIMEKIEEISLVDADYVYVAVPDYFFGLIEKKKFKWSGVGLILAGSGFHVTEIIKPRKRERKRGLREKANLRAESLETLISLLISKISEREKKGLVDVEIEGLKAQIYRLKNEIEDLKRQINQLKRTKGVSAQQPVEKVLVTGPREADQIMTEWEGFIRNPQIPEFARSNPWIDVLRSKTKKNKKF